MYAQAAIKPNTLLRNGAYGIVMRGVQKCTCAGASLRGRKRLPLCCIKLDTATDPACGSGNFLTETYICLRKLEDALLREMRSGQMSLGFGEDEEAGLRVSLNQFYGIEVNDFAVAVADTALWISRLKANGETSMFIELGGEDFPLHESANIAHANALRMDWNEVLPAEECDYIMGNPPFRGQALKTIIQSEDVAIVFGKGNPATKLDYVLCWYKKAQEYIRSNDTIAAFVSTNSICQGESIPAFWNEFIRDGAEIQFAYKSFPWTSEAADKATVFCVIVGFSTKERSVPKILFDGDDVLTTIHINPYLLPAPDVWIEGRCSTPPKGMSKLVKGSEPTDDGNLFLTTQEREKLLHKYPELEKYIRPFIGAKEFMNEVGGDTGRYCLWFEDEPKTVYEKIPEISERIKRVKEFRLRSTADRVRKKADYPEKFCQIRQPDTDYIIVPRHTSSNREYIPLGFVSPEYICGDSASLIPNANKYQFGVMMSKMHYAWTAVVCGRLGNGFRYSPSIYNNFPWPDSTPEQRAAIEACAQSVLDARNIYPNKSLADLYDPDHMPADLLAAHKALDKAVEAAYGVDFDGDEERIVAHLFKLYADKTAKDI